MLVHTNHFLCDRMKPADTSRFMAHDTFLRYGLAKKMLEDKKGVVTVDNVKEILAAHKDYPDSICRHEDALDPAGLRMCTVFSIVMDMTALKMELLRGNPCENKYREV